MIEICENCKEHYCNNCDVVDSCPQCGEDYHCSHYEINSDNVCSKECEKDALQELEYEELEESD